MRRIAGSIITFVFLFTALSPIASAKEQGKKLELADKAASAILIERDSGAILYEKNSAKQLPPASMTKIMTMLLVMEAIDEGKLSWNEKIRASEYAASMGGSQIFLEAGEEMTTKELLKGVAVASGNDASVALAERIAGSEEAFVKMMNDKAKELGLENTEFQNSTGLPAKNHYSTSYDMAIIAKELLKYEKITDYTGIYEDYLREDTDKKFWLVNTNRLVKFYSGVDGLKTGYTNEAKYCLTATAKKDGMRIIAVVMGAPTPKERNRQITKMLDYAFNHYKAHHIYDRNKELAEIKVNKGKKAKLQLVTSEPISILTKKGETLENVKKKIVVPDIVDSPVHKGDKIGKIIFERDGKVLVESPLAATEDIGDAGWWHLFKRSMSWFGKAS